MRSFLRVIGLLSLGMLSLAGLVPNSAAASATLAPPAISPAVARHAAPDNPAPPSGFPTLWAAQPPGHLAVITMPGLATASELVTAEIYQGIVNGRSARGGTLIWLNHGDGAYEDTYWPNYYATTYHVPMQQVPLTAALAMAAEMPTATTVLTTPIITPTSTSSAVGLSPTITATNVIVSPLTDMTGTSTITPTPTAIPTIMLTPTTRPSSTVAPAASALLSSTQPITRYVIWDPSLPATIDVASTIAAIDHVLAIAPSDESAGLNLKGLGYHLFIDLRGRFHSRNDAYTWALANLGAAANQHVIAIQGVGDHGENGPPSGARDYAVAIGAFQFSVPPADTLYDRILAAFPPETVVLGFDPTDQKTFTYKDSLRGDVGINTALARNLSAHSAFQPRQLAPQPDADPATLSPDPTKVYLAFTISDGDAIGLPARFYDSRGGPLTAASGYTGLWNDTNRGRIPLGWTISPAMAQFQRGALARLYAGRTPNDYFVSWLPGGYYNYHAMPPTAQHDVLAWDRSLMADAGLRVGWTYDHDAQGHPVFSSSEGAAYVNAIPSLGWIQGYHDDQAYLNADRYNQPLFEGRTPRPILFNAVDARGDEPEYTEFKINQITDNITQRPLFLSANFVIWHVRTLGDLIQIWHDLQAQRPGLYALVTPGQLMALQTAYFTRGGVRAYQPALYSTTAGPGAGAVGTSITTTPLSLGSNHLVGHADGQGWAATSADGPGMLPNGPGWTSVPPGPKVAAFRVMVGNSTADDAVVATLSVVDRSSNSTLGRLILHRRDFAAAMTYQDFLVPFTLAPKYNQLDLRVAVTGMAFIKLGVVYVHAAQLWSATDLNVEHDLGRASPTGTGWMATPISDTVAGYLVRVPATTAVPGGVHSAVWQLSIDDNRHTDEVVATVAIYDRDTRHVLASRNITRQEFILANQPQDFVLPFTNQSGHHLDLRTYYRTRATITQYRVLVRD